MQGLFLFDNLGEKVSVKNGRFVMSKNFLIFFIVFIVALVGCSKTYYGKFVTANVKQEPVDEFQVKDFAVLTFENKNVSKPEDWKWEFWAFYKNEKIGVYRLQSRVVAGSRSYYLVEIVPGMRASTISNFPAMPNYDRVKERLTAYLSEKKAPGL